MTEFAAAFLISAAAGVLSGWGVGGGSLLTVCLTMFLGAQQREAQAINLLFFLPTAAVSLWFHGKNGLVDRKVWASAALSGTAAALLCGVAAVAVDASLLRRPFGVLLLLCGGAMLAGAAKR